MEKIVYLKINNFKSLADNAEIHFGHPAVLIGPNNSGKTSALQALTLWHHGVKRWVGNKKTQGVPLNRLEIVQTPVKELRSYFKSGDAKVNQKIHITVGVKTEKGIRDCTMVFTYQGNEQLYAKPDDETLKDRETLQIAADMDVRVLYPMSGIAREEGYIHLNGGIDALIGQGKTAEVLRNLCYKIIENDPNGKREDWKETTSLMRQLFQVELDEPKLDSFNGTVELSYRSPETGTKKPLDIAQTGRGLQEMLLLVAYLFTHKNSVLLLDEPDAHLELLRQRQVFLLLQHLAAKTNSQIIIATHSEIILKETSDENLIFLLAGEPVFGLGETIKKHIRQSLGTFALEHFYKARLAKHIFYIEGSTDIEMLREFAVLLKHKEAIRILDGTLNYYYTADNFSEAADFSADMSRAGGAFQRMDAHFAAMKNAVPALKAIGIFDGDGKRHEDFFSESKAHVFWKLYELENYFTTPEVLRNFFKKERKDDAFAEKAILSAMLEFVFNGNEKAFAQFEQLGKDLQNVTFVNNLANQKASLFLEKVFARHAEISGQPVLLRKTDFHRLIPFLPVDEVNPEVKGKLDLLTKYLS